MSINEINSNGKSKVISRQTGVMGKANNGISSKSDTRAPSHSSRPLTNLGHASNPNTMKKMVSDKGTGGKGMKGSY